MVVWLLVCDLVVGDTVVTKSPQVLSKGSKGSTAEPVYLQGLYTASVQAVRSVTYDDCSSEVQLMYTFAAALRMQADNG